MAGTMWYHGGDLVNGRPKAGPLYVVNTKERAAGYLHDKPTGKVYQLRDEFQHLVKRKSSDTGEDDSYPIREITQADIKNCGGVLAMFEEVPPTDCATAATAPDDA